MATHIFPGVYTTITDNSFYTQPLPGSVAFIALAAEKGPDNSPTLISSVQELIETFGQPNPSYYGQGWYVAMQYLNVQGSIYVVRVLPNYDDTEGAPTSADYANVCFTYNSQTTSVELSSLDSMHDLGTIEAALAVPSTGPDMIVYAVGRGSYYNDLAIRLTAANDPYFSVSDTYTLDVYEVNDDSTSTLVETYTVCLDRNAVDYSGESAFIEDVVNNYSNRVRVKIGDNFLITRDYAFPFEDAEVGVTYEQMDNGTDGGIWTTEGSVINPTVVNNLLAQAYTGLLDRPDGTSNADILDCDVYLFSIIFDAGYAHAVKDAMMTLADSRGDCFVFLDNATVSIPSASPQKAIENKQANHHYTNSWQGAVFEPYTKIFDTITGRNVWMNPVYHVARAFAKTERDYNLWFPFAGLTRGLVAGIRDFKYRLFGSAYRNSFKLNQINPIVRFASGGDCIWGNWTCQNRASALQNIHVVLTLLYIKRVLEYNLKFFVFELNDAYTWNQIKNSVTDFLVDLQSKRALEWFTVDVYASDYDKKLNRCQVKVDLRVTGAIEVISVELAVNSSGSV